MDSVSSERVADVVELDHITASITNQSNDSTSTDTTDTGSMETTHKNSPDTALNSPPKNLLPSAEKMKLAEQAIPYLEPEWGGPSDEKCNLEIIKKNIVVKTLGLNEKSFYVFGRLQVCDVPIDHPSLSRFHAVLQHRSVSSDSHKIGWYLYDLETTHGTLINKTQLTPKVYYRIRVGDVLKFAASSRLHILQGPEEDHDDGFASNITKQMDTDSSVSIESVDGAKKAIPVHSGFKRPMIGPARKSRSKPRRQNEITSKLEEDMVHDSDRKDESISETIKIEQLPSVDSDKETEVLGPESDITDSNLTDSNLTDSNLTDPNNLTKLSSENPVQDKPSPVGQPEIPYLEPKWGGQTDSNYSIEIIKNGTVVQTLDLKTKSFYVFGRLPVCDVPMDHPSLSRFHAVLQFCAAPNDRHEVGWYLYDLETTHGTRINKLQINPRVYYRVRVGHVLKFAGSSRLHILQGPDDDQEDESQLSVTEMKQQREQKKRAEELLDKLGEDEVEEVPDRGCTWGISDDAPVDAEVAETVFADAIPQNEELYLDDPKKTLKGFFEREGYDLPEYQFEEAGHAKHKCIVEVPVDSPTGQPVYAEAIVVGKRKDAVIACALEACRILDRYGLLRKKDHEAKKVKLRSWEENDYYNSDEDEFLDRTGEIEKKRKQRMKRAGKVTEVTETHKSLTTKLEVVNAEMQDIEKQLEAAKKNVSTESGDLDDLDAYMLSIKKGGIDTKTRMTLKRRLFDLKKGHARLERLVNISKPALSPAIAKFKLGQLHGRIGGQTRKISVKQGPDLPQPVTVNQHQPALVIHQVVETEKEEIEEKESQGKAVENKALKENRLLDSVLETSDNVKLKQTIGIKKEQATKTASEQVNAKPDVSTEQKSIKHNISTNQKAVDINVQTQDTTSSTMETISDASTVKQEKQLNNPPYADTKRNASVKKVQVKKMKTAELSGDYCTDDPNYAVWMPPKDQTGDGKTHLNAKFGY